MPAELPGFFFDVKKNRYFPLSSKPATGTISFVDKDKDQLQEQSTLQKDRLSKGSSDHHSNVLWLLQTRELGDSLGLGRSWKNNHVFQRFYLEAQASHPKVWESTPLVSAEGALEHLSFPIQSNEGIRDANFLALGQNDGLVNIVKIEKPGEPSGDGDRFVPLEFSPLDNNNTQHPKRGPPNVKIFPPIHLSPSKVTSIKRLGRYDAAITDDNNEIAIFTTLGSGNEGGALHILKCDRQSPSSLQSSPCIVTVCSVWTASCCSSSKASLGLSKGAALVDLETDSMRWICRSRSDVLSQQCDSTGNIVLCGFRNGTIALVDTRNPCYRLHAPTTPYPHSSSNNERIRNRRPIVKTSSKPWYDSNTVQMESSICSLVLLRSDERYFLASAMNGSIQLWDRRLLERGSVQSYDGNFNTHTSLQIGVDPSEALLISGGEDRCIRLWSIRSGLLLKTLHGLESPTTTICWPGIQRNNIVNMETSRQGEHAWEAWLGSATGLLYAYGSAH